MPRDFQLPRRSLALGTRGMAATSHPLATLAAVEALREGGNAIDGALAAVAVLCVVEPAQTGLGGDCFALISEPDGRLRALNGSGRATRHADADRLAERGVDAIAPTSPHAITVPGAVHAWGVLSKEARLPWDRLLQPAIEAAGGAPVAPRAAWDWANNEALIAASPSLREHYSRGGVLPREGDVWALPALQTTLQRLASQGPDAFYEGAIAADIARTVQEAGGALDEADLAAHTSEWVTPVSRAYRGHDVIELPPANHGITALQILGIMERHDMAAHGPGSAEALHVEIEAARIAYAARDEMLADPQAMTRPAAELIDDAMIDALAAKLDPARATQAPAPSHGETDTVYLSIVDGDGRAVSFINSLYTPFGSGLVTQGGVLLQSRGAGFVMTPGHPNRLGPGKRPLHTLIPGLVREAGETTLCFGVMGGPYQACGHAHLLSHLVDHGQDVQQALEAPRAFFAGPAVHLERTADRAAFEGLAAMGHRVIEAPSPIGGGQAIRIDRERGVLIGGSDPRKDGFALGF